MKKRHEDFLMNVGLPALCAGTEAVWMGILTAVTSRIPVVGIPFAVILGTAGVVGTFYLANLSRIGYDEWRKLS